MITEPLVELRGATIGYDGSVVLESIDFRIEPGEFVALLGANGSGKSTLVRSMFGLAQSMAGTIQLFGTDASHFNQRWRIGYVPQRTTIAGALPSTVVEVVTSGRLARLGIGRRLRATDRSAVARSIQAIGLGGMEDRLVGDLSGGQQRRVTIARALASEPELLVLDEPTAGIDAESQELLSLALAELSAAGTTMLLIAHEVGPLAPLVSRIVCLADGRVSFDGPAASHFSHGAHGQHDDHDGEHLHAHGEPPPRPGTGLLGW